MLKQIIVALVVALFASFPVFADTLRVPQDYFTIQWAIDASKDGDEIIVSPGTYIEAIIQYHGKAITVRGTDPSDWATVEQTVVNGLGRGCPFWFAAEDTSCVLAGLTVTGGVLPYGGGIEISGGSPTITRCLVTKNTGVFNGGGIHITNASAKILDCVIRENDGGERGGGIYVLNPQPDILISGCTIEQNAVTEEGGGIAIFGLTPYAQSPIVQHCTIRDNHSLREGGGIWAWGSLARVANCTIVQNSADSLGGGIYVESSDVEVSHCMVRANTARIGAGIIGVNGMRIHNCVVTQNVGGGLYLGGYSELLNCTIVENVGRFGVEIDSYGKTVIWNSIIRMNGHNFSQFGWPEIWYSNFEGASNREGNIDADPLFMSRRGFEYLLGLGSPAIDAGDPSILDGISDSHPKWPAFYPNGARSDMGAYGGPANRGWLK